MIEDPLEPLLSPMKAIAELLDRTAVKGVVVGGVASSMLGKPRYTRDVDVVVLLDTADIESFLECAASVGLVPRIPDPVRFARKRRVLLLRHEESGIPVDISMGVLPFEEEMIRRAKKVSVGPVSFLLPTPEDFIITKAVAHRERDMLDIQDVLDLTPRIDVRRVRKWVREFAKALEMPEILEDLERLLARPKSTHMRSSVRKKRT